MPISIMITIAIAVVVLVLGLFVLLRKGWTISEIALWPPTFKMTPPKSNVPLTGADTFLAESESKLGKIDLEGASNTTNVTARNKSEIGDINIKRTQKP